MDSPLSGPRDETRTERWFSNLLAFLLPLSLGLNCFLGWRVYSSDGFRSRESPKARRADAVGARNALTPGSLVPPLRGRHLDGSLALIDYKTSPAPTLVYFMSPKCIWCSRNRENFRAIVTQTKAKLHVVCVSQFPDELPDYIAKNGLEGLGIEFLLNVPGDLLGVYGFSATPQTLVISKEGRVEKAWRGAYTVEKQHDVEEFFGVHLPGLASTPSLAAE
jgi:peroxiredoxin